MSRISSPLRFQRTGHWLRLGRHRVWLESSPLADQLLAQQEAERVRERARLFRTDPDAR